MGETPAKCAVKVNFKTSNPTGRLFATIKDVLENMKSKADNVTY